MDRVLHGMAEQELWRLYDGTVPWATWLDRAARYGSYGFTNTLLIAAQSRAVTIVDSSEGWRVRGRQVRKGEQGIRIVSRPGRVRSLFELTQTVGEVLPAPDPMTAEQAYDLLHAQVTGHGIMAGRGMTSGAAGGAVALAHRLGHLLLHQGTLDEATSARLETAGRSPGCGLGEPCDGVRRVEADSIAYLVLTRLGVDPVLVILGPVPGWADGSAPYAMIRRVGERVLRTAARIERLLGTPPPLIRMHAAAHAFFRGCHPASWVPGYLAGRGLVAEGWEIGYAPRTWRGLTDHLCDLGFPADQIVAAGLARRTRGGKIFDTFRDRAMLPLRAPDGAVVAFIGRRRDDGAGPKYLNSPDSPIFAKGELLYGWYEAARGARPILVEGPLDVIAVAAAGGDWAPLAPCGTSLTTAHARLVGPDAVVAFDNDRAGRAAAVRAWTVLKSPVDWVSWPEGKDPADLAADPELIREALNSPRPLADLVIDTRIAQAGGTLEFSEQRWSAARAAASVIARLPADQVAGQVATTAIRLNLPPNLITEALVTAVSP